MGAIRTQAYPFPLQLRAAVPSVRQIGRVRNPLPRFTRIFLHRIRTRSVIDARLDCILTISSLITAPAIIQECNRVFSQFVFSYPGCRLPPLATRASTSNIVAPEALRVRLRVRCRFFSGKYRAVRQTAAEIRPTYLVLYRRAKMVNAPRNSVKLAS